MYIGCIPSISHMHIMYSICQYMYIGCILSTCHMSQCEVYRPMSLADNFANVLLRRAVALTSRAEHVPTSSMYIGNDNLFTAATRTLANMTHTASSDRHQKVQMHQENPKFTFRTFFTCCKQKKYRFWKVSPTWKKKSLLLFSLLFFTFWLLSLLFSLLFT